MQGWGLEEKVRVGEKEYLLVFIEPRFNHCPPSSVNIKLIESFLLLMWLIEKMPIIWWCHLYFGGNLWQLQVAKPTKPKKNLPEAKSTQSNMPHQICKLILITEFTKQNLLKQSYLATLTQPNLPIQLTNGQKFQKGPELTKFLQRKSLLKFDFIEFLHAGVVYLTCTQCWNSVEVVLGRFEAVSFGQFWNFCPIVTSSY